MSPLPYPADRLSVAEFKPRQLLSFQEAFHDGMLAFGFGHGIDSCPIQPALEGAWWRRGWRQARAEAILKAADESERREVDPEFNWEGHPDQTIFSHHDTRRCAESGVAKLAASDPQSSPQGAVPAGTPTRKASAQTCARQLSRSNPTPAAAGSESTQMG